MKKILDNSNIVESYPGISLPLTISFVERAYHQVFRGAVYRLTGSEAIVSSLDSHLQHMVVGVQGRVYYHLNGWYMVIALFPLRKQITHIWRHMLGIDANDTLPNPPALSWQQKLAIVRRVRKNARQLPDEMQTFHASFQQVYRQFRAHDLSRLSHQELTAIYQTIETSVVVFWDVTLANDMYAFVYTWLVDKYVPSGRRYLSQLSHLESMKPLHALLDLARQATQLSDAPSVKVANNVARRPADQQAFWQAFDDYIERYGDRYLEELKLESETYRTSPRLLIEKIVEYSTQLDELDSKLTLGVATMQPSGVVASLLLKRATTGIRNRELSRLDRSRLYGMVRAIVRQIGNNLVKAGDIDAARDVFYLTIDEMLAPTHQQAKQVIAARKKEYKTFANQILPSRIVIDETAMSSLPPAVQVTGTGPLVGTPVSGGSVEAEVLVVHNPFEVTTAQGKILVTKTTDPGWVFLLVQAKGIIAEKGSLLSHTAIVARELSVPAVVSVDGATTRLKTGQRVRLNGTTGTIEAL